jgi:Ca2+-transporting ATPase
MLQKPRPFTTTFFNLRELSTSIIQGLMITVGALFIYQYGIYLALDEATTRTMVFVVLVTANIFLTLVNRSFYYSIFTTLLYKNNLVGIIIFITIIITGLLLYVKTLNTFFGFDYLNVSHLSASIGVGFIAVIWYELVKLYKRKSIS